MADTQPEPPLDGLPAKAAAADKSAPIQPIPAREKFKPRTRKKVRLRDDLVHGESRMEAVAQPGPVPELETAPPSGASVGTWSRETPVAAISGMDAEYHAKVRVNQIRIERSADALKIVIWSAVFGIAMPAFTLYEGQEWLSWKRWLLAPAIPLTLASAWGLYSGNRRFRQWANTWNLTLMFGYGLMLIGLCSGFVAEEFDAAEGWYLAFVYGALIVSLIWTPLWRIRRLEREWALIDAQKEAAQAPPPATPEDDDIEASGEWDEEADTADRRPPPR